MSSAVATLAPQAVALLLLTPAQYAVFSLLYIALGLAQSAQNSLVVDPWLRQDIDQPTLPAAPIVWAAIPLSLVAATVPVVVGYVSLGEFWLAALGVAAAQSRNSARLLGVILSWRSAVLSDLLFVSGFTATLIVLGQGLGWSDLWWGIVVGSAIGMAPWTTHFRLVLHAPLVWFGSRRREIAPLWLESTVLDIGVAGPPLALSALMPTIDFAVVRATSSALLPVRLVLGPLRGLVASQPPRSLCSGRLFALLCVAGVAIGSATAVALMAVGSWTVAEQGVLPLLKPFAVQVGLMSALQFVGTTLYMAGRAHCSPSRLLSIRLADTSQQVLCLGVGFVIAGLDGVVWGYVALSAVSTLLWRGALLKVDDPRDGRLLPG